MATATIARNKAGWRRVNEAGKSMGQGETSGATKHRQRLPCKSTHGVLTPDYRQITGRWCLIVKAFEKAGRQ
jgi:hypothetical protein